MRVTGCLLLLGVAIISLCSATTQPKNLLIAVVTSDRSNIPSDFMVPSIEKELDLMTGPDGGKYFNLANFNKMLQAEGVSESLVSVLMQNGDWKNVKDNAFRSTISKVYKKQLLNIDLLMTIKINVINNSVEYQFDLYQTDSIKDKPFSLDVYKAVLSSRRIRYANAVMNLNDESFSDKIKRALRGLFPETNKPPAILLVCNNQPFENCDSRPCVLNVKESDSLSIVKAVVLDDDSELVEMKYSWSLNGVSLPPLMASKIQRADEFKVIKRTGHDTLALRVMDGIVSSNEYKFILRRVPKPNIYAFNTTQFIVDDHYLFFIAPRRLTNVILGTMGSFDYQLFEDGKELPTVVRELPNDSPSRNGDLRDPKTQLKILRSLRGDFPVKGALVVNFEKYSTEAFYFPLNLDTKKTYRLRMTSRAEGLNFGSEEREIRFKELYPLTAFFELYSMIGARFTQAENLKARLAWSPSLGLRLRALKAKTGFPLDLQASIIWPVYGKSAIDKDNPDRDIKLPRVVPRLNAMLDLWRNNHLRAAAGPSFMYYERRVDNIYYKELMKGIAGDFWFSTGFLESSVGVNVLWGPRTDGKKAMVFQIGSAVTLPFYK